MKPPGPALPRLWEVPTPKLPKPLSFDSHNKAEADAMVAWINEHLEVRRAERKNKHIMEVYEEFCDHGGVDFDPETGYSTLARPTLKDLIDQAWYEDDIEPLKEYFRKIDPDLPDLIHKRNRGQGGGKHHRNRKAEDAAKDVRFIRELWQREYGRWKRPESNPPTAEQIAADFHKVDVRSVRKALSRLK